MAGTCKPASAGKEASYIILGGKTNGGTVWNSSTNNGLFNGVSVDSWYEGQGWWWFNADDFIEIEVYKKFKIWRSGITSLISYNAKLKTKQWNGSAYIDISASQPTPTQIPNDQWELTSTELPAGKYRFETVANRADSEWYIEESVMVKYLIRDGSKLKTIATGNLTTVCNTTDANTVIEQGFINSGMSGLTSWNNSLMSQIENKPPKIVIYKK